jgi:hypothetical protein
MQERCSGGELPNGVCFLRARGITGMGALGGNNLGYV